MEDYRNMVYALENKKIPSFKEMLIVECDKCKKKILYNKGWWHKKDQKFNVCTKCWNWTEQEGEYIFYKCPRVKCEKVLELVDMKIIINNNEYFNGLTFHTLDINRNPVIRFLFIDNLDKINRENIKTIKAMRAGAFYGKIDEYVHFIKNDSLFNKKAAKFSFNYDDEHRNWKFINFTINSDYFADVLNAI